MNALKPVLALTLSLAALNAGAAPFPRDLMGVGSVFSFTRDIQFGRARTKAFCDGKERVTALLHPGHCCVIVRGAPTAYAARVTLKASVPRPVSYINWRRTKVIIDAPSETYVRCRSHFISAKFMKKAFGDVIQIDHVEAPASLPAGDEIEL